MKLKYLILKIVGILGIVAATIIWDYFVSFYERDSYYRYVVVSLMQIALLVFSLITIAGFSRIIARAKAIIDFHTDFDYDPDLDGYPRLKKYLYVKNIVLCVLAALLVVVSLISRKIEALADIQKYFFMASLAVAFITTLIGVISFFVVKVETKKFEMGLFYLFLLAILSTVLAHFECSYLVMMIFTTPLFSVALICFALSSDDGIFFEDIIDNLLDEEYTSYYAELCRREKEQEKKEKKTNKFNLKSEIVKRIKINQIERKNQKKENKAKKKENKKTSERTKSE